MREREREKRERDRERKRGNPWNVGMVGFNAVVCLNSEMKWRIWQLKSGIKSG